MSYIYSDPFKEYLREAEGSKADKGYIWSTAIGLQAVDGLKPSEYLIDTAKSNIEGDITLEEARHLIESYYESKSVRDSGDDRMEEADKVSMRIAEVLSETGFTFGPNEYISIHRKLFQDVYRHAGRIRDYNISKKEWVLDGASVMYGSASELEATLEYDLSVEKSFNYRGLSMDEIIHHLAIFISRLWQIHIFGEGNTRTTAVFFIKYLRTLGFSVTNEIFANNAWYFRNALVRANYTDLSKNVHETTEFLELFLRNLLMNEKHELHNRTMHISGIWNRENLDSGDKKVDIEPRKVDIEVEKVDIGPQKVDIQVAKVDIEKIIKDKTEGLSLKTKEHIRHIFDVVSIEGIFGREKVMEITGLKPAAASKLIKQLKELEIIENVTGYGKGKYKFSSK